MAVPLLLAGAVAAQEITVTARSGGLDLTGRYLGFDGEYLRIATEHGELTLDYAAVECDGAACPDPESFVPELRLSGTPQLAELILPALVEGFARDRDLAALREEVGTGIVRYTVGEDGERGPRLRVALRPTTTEDGIADLLASEADIALAARELTPAELTLARDAGLGRLAEGERVRVLALDALVPVVAPGHPVRSVSLAELASAFAGDITDWSALGGEGPITLHLGPEETGLAQGFVARFLVATGRSLSPDVVRHEDNDALARAVAADPGALGLLPFGDFGIAQPLVLEEACGLRSVARVGSVKAEDYPLTTPLFLYLPARRLHPAAQDFLTWTSSEAAQFVLRRAGVVGQEPVPIPVSAQGERLAAAIARAGTEVSLADLQRLVRFIDGRVRLSLTFRFANGDPPALDGPSRSNLLLLAERIAEGRYRGQVLTLAGFDDGRGTAAEGRARSLADAERVRDEIVRLLGGELPEDVTLETRGFGEVLPMGCDDTVWGRRTNRRIELWTGASGLEG